MNKLIKGMASVCYNTGCILGHLVAKFQLGWNQHYFPDNPGFWER